MKGASHTGTWSNLSWVSKSRARVSPSSWVRNLNCEQVDLFPPSPAYIFSLFRDASPHVATVSRARVRIAGRARENVTSHPLWRHPDTFHECWIKVCAIISAMPPSGRNASSVASRSTHVPRIFVAFIALVCIFSAPYIVWSLYRHRLTASGSRGWGAGVWSLSKRNAIEGDPRGRRSAGNRSVIGNRAWMSVKPASKRSAKKSKFDLSEIPAPISDLLTRLVVAAQLPGQNFTGDTSPHISPKNALKTHGKNIILICWMYIDHHCSAMQIHTDICYWIIMGTFTRSAIYNPLFSRLPSSRTPLMGWTTSCLTSRSPFVSATLYHLLNSVPHYNRVVT